MLTLSLVLLGTSGCLMDRSPPPPPFRTAEYGAGLETHNPGRLVQLHQDGDEDAEMLGRLRVSAKSMRLQDAHAVPLGSIRLGSEGYHFRARDGQHVCTLTPHAHKVRCGDRTWVATPRNKEITLTDKDHGDTRIPLNAEVPRIESGGRAWSGHANTLIYHAYTQAVGDRDAFAAYTLLAWSLRSQDNDRTRQGEH